MVEAGVARPLLIVILAPPGQRDEQQVAMRGRRSDVPRNFVSVHLGHADVEENRFRPERVEHVERRATAVRDGDGRAERAEELAECVRSVAIVVDDQDSSIGKMSRRL